MDEMGGTPLSFCPFVLLGNANVRDLLTLQSTPKTAEHLCPFVLLSYLHNF